MHKIIHPYNICIHTDTTYAYILIQHMHTNIICISWLHPMHTYIHLDTNLNVFIHKHSCKNTMHAYLAHIHSYNHIGIKAYSNIVSYEYTHMHMYKHIYSLDYIMFKVNMNRSDNGHTT